MKKIFSLFCLLIVLPLVLAGCAGKDAKKSDKLTVVASFYPMAEFSRAVGGEKAEVITLVPDGAEPHDWEPAPKDLTRLGRAQLFVYNGMVEPWAENSLEAVKERKILAVEAGKGLYAIDGKKDPHVWISPKKAMQEVEAIAKAYAQADEKNAAFYQKNASAYIAELEKIDKELTALSANAKRKTFVTSHRAFGHLAADYNLEQKAISGISPEAEPNPKEIKELMEFVRKENVQYIFFETLASPKVAEMLAKETGVKTAVLDPLEGLDEDGKKAGLNYLKIQKQNLESLKKALME